MIVFNDNLQSNLTIDAITSRIYPDYVALGTMLDRFEKEDESGNIYLSDSAEIMLENIIHVYKHVLSIPKATLNFLWSNPFSKRYPVAIRYPNILSWSVFEVFWNADTNPILIEDVPIIRRMLNVPAGKEQEIFDEWQAYWAKIDFETRKSIARM